ncbi:MAG: RNA polymerase sigma factor [Oscillospiraceae bacterium]|jgi:RNA polymerase sigma-70 factor (ECF subfamily)|nr:RNA polymerase sigma factor [Oscillospiraceae bacterium]
MANTFDEIYSAHFLYVRKFLLRLCNGNEYTADDLTQETFFQAYRSIHRFEGNCRVETWLCSIAQNVFYTFLRKEKKQRNLEKMQSAEKEDACFNQEKYDLERDVALVLSRLPDLVSKVLSYRLFQDLPFSEISGLLGISGSSAKVIYHRGRIKLKNILEKEYGYEL